MIIHTVRAGDTIYSVAREYGVSPGILAGNNGITGGLTVGDELVVLIPEVTHTVRPGETIFSIAEIYGITARELYRNNYFLNGRSTLYTGQTLVISYTDRPTRGIITNGYAYPFVSEEVLDTSLPYVTYLAPFTYGMTYDGNLIDLDDERLLSQAREYGTEGAMHISTLTRQDTFDSALATNIIQNSTARETLLQDIRAFAASKGYSLIDVDFEYIAASDREGYGLFIEQVKTLGYPVIVAAAPKTSADQRGRLYEGHDYSILGDAADYLFVMTYEWGYTYGPPMAVAPLPNVRAVLDYAVTDVDSRKIMMGIPNYGYDWTLPFVEGQSRATSIGNRRAVEIAKEYGAEIMFDTTARAPYFNYTDREGRAHEVWFENATSIREKLELINEYNLAGVGYWNLMRVFPQLWLIQNAMFSENF